MAQVPPPAEVLTSGRGVQRGGGRERPHAGDAPAGAMSRLSMQEAPYKRRSPYEKYVDVAYKDAGKDTRGETYEQYFLSIFF